MNRQIEIPASEHESTNLERRGFLTRFGVAVAAAPVLIALSRSASARVSDGGHDGDDGGHGVSGALGGGDGDGETDRIDDIVGYQEGHDEVYREHHASNYSDRDDSIGMDVVD